MRDRLAGCTKFGAAVVTGVLVGRLVVLCPEVRSRLCRVGRHRLPHLTNPAVELVRIEVAVATVGEGGEGGVCEPKHCRIGTFSRSSWIPRPGLRTDALYRRARDQAHDVDLMGRLVEDRTTAFGCVEFFGPARAIEIVRVVERINHAHLAERAAVEEVAQMSHGR